MAISDEVKRGLTEHFGVIPAKPPDPLVARERVVLGTSAVTPAGYWLVGDWTRIALLRRPNRLQRLMARWLLGWRWRDGPL